MTYLHKGLWAEVGWLAPDGEYYVPSDRTSQWLHYDVAKAIVENLHPDIRFADNQLFYSEQMYDLGYIRVDLKRTLFHSDASPTEKQFDTLFNLFQMGKKWADEGAPEGIRNFLVLQGGGNFEFLRRDTDDNYNIPLVTPSRLTRQ